MLPGAKLIIKIQTGYWDCVADLGCSLFNVGALEPDCWSLNPLSTI